MKKLVVVAVLCLCLVRAQSQCTLERLADDTSMVASLLANSLAAQGGSLPQITIMDHTVVCLAVDVQPGIYRSASLVILYSCTSTDDTVCPSAAGS